MMGLIEKLTGTYILAGRRFRCIKPEDLSSEDFRRCMRLLRDLATAWEAQEFEQFHRSLGDQFGFPDYDIFFGLLAYFIREGNKFKAPEHRRLMTVLRGVAEEVQKVWEQRLASDLALIDQLVTGSSVAPMSELVARLHEVLPDGEADPEEPSLTLEERCQEMERSVLMYEHYERFDHLFLTNLEGLAVQFDRAGERDASRIVRDMGDDIQVFLQLHGDREFAASVRRRIEILEDWYRHGQQQKIIRYGQEWPGNAVDWLRIRLILSRATIVATWRGDLNHAKMLSEIRVLMEEGRNNAIGELIDRQVPLDVISADFWNRDPDSDYHLSADFEQAETLLAEVATDPDHPDMAKLQNAVGKYQRVVAMLPDGTTKAMIHERLAMAYQLLGNRRNEFAERQQVVNILRPQSTRSESNSERLARSLVRLADESLDDVHSLDRAWQLAEEAKTTLSQGGLERSTTYLLALSKQQWVAELERDWFALVSILEQTLDRMDEGPEKCNVLIFLGQQYLLGLGRVADSLATLEQGLDQARLTDNQIAQVVALVSLANLNADFLDRRGTALKYAEEAEHILGRIATRPDGLNSGKGRVLLYWMTLGMFYLNRGLPERAEECWQALRVLEHLPRLLLPLETTPWVSPTPNRILQIDMMTTIGQVLSFWGLSMLGLVQLGLNEVGQMIISLVRDPLHDSLDLSQQLKYATGTSDALSGLGWVSLLIGDLSTAIELLSQATTGYTTHGEVSLFEAMVTFYLLAGLHWVAGSPELALETLQPVIEHSESVMLGLPSEQMKLGYARLGTRIYQFAVRLSVQCAKPTDHTLSLVERGRSRAFLDLLSLTRLSHPSKMSADLGQAEDSALEDMKQIVSRSQGSGDVDPDAWTSVRARLWAIWSQMEKDRDLHEYVALRKGDVLDFRELLRCLRNI